MSSEKCISDQYEFVSNLKNNWSTIPLDDPLTVQLKRAFGAFAGSEADAVGVQRRAGLPSLYVSKDGGKTWTAKPLDETASVDDIKRAIS